MTRCQLESKGLLVGAEGTKCSLFFFHRIKTSAHRNQFITPYSPSHASDATFQFQGLNASTEYFSLLWQLPKVRYQRKPKCIYQRKKLPKQQKLRKYQLSEGEKKSKQNQVISHLTSTHQFKSYFLKMMESYIVYCPHIDFFSFLLFHMLFLNHTTISSVNAKCNFEMMSLIIEEGKAIQANLASCGKCNCLI